MLLPHKSLIAAASTLLALCVLSPVASAQAKADADLSDQERAKRDANKVFSFIKFHAVRPTAAAAPAAAPLRAAEKAEVKAAPLARTGDVQVAALDSARPGKATEPAPRASEAAGDALVAQALLEPPAAGSAGGITAALAAPGAPAPSVEPVPEPEPEVGLQLIAHVEPEVPRQHLAQVRSGSVVVRFTVGPDGKVVTAAAREGAQRRLANAAIRAVQQWRFAPLPTAREAEVEIVFDLEAL